MGRKLPAPILRGQCSHSIPVHSTDFRLCLRHIPKSPALHPSRAGTLLAHPRNTRPQIRLSLCLLALPNLHPALERGISLSAPPDGPKSPARPTTPQLPASPAG